VPQRLDRDKVVVMPLQLAHSLRRRGAKVEITVVRHPQSLAADLARDQVANDAKNMASPYRYKR
jgi:hypothetical protein